MEELRWTAAVPTADDGQGAWAAALADEGPDTPTIVCPHEDEAAAEEGIEQAPQLTPRSSVRASQQMYIVGAERRIELEEEELTPPRPTPRDPASICDFVRGAETPPLQISHGSNRRPDAPPGVQETRKGLPAGPGANPEQEVAAKAAAVKLARKRAKILTKQLGDSLREALKPPARPGTLRVADVSEPTFHLIFPADCCDSSVVAAGGKRRVLFLTKRHLVSIFGAKVERGGSREQRFDCGAATVTFDRAASTLLLEYKPVAMQGGNAWWCKHLR